jgi:hypothetical protein
VLYGDGAQQVDEIFYKNVIDTSSYDESDAGSEFMMDIATLINEHTKR